MHQKLFDATINTKKHKYILRQAIKYANRINSRKWQNDNVLIDFILALSFDKAIRKYESTIKDDIIKDDIIINRNKKRLMYVASSHGDSASDHRDWQGKIYVDANYKLYDIDGKIDKYVKSHNTKTIQWLTNKPVYFITRPNCRHYLVSYTIDEILSGNYVIPYRTIGKRGEYQTPRQHTYQNYINTYEVKLETLKKMGEKIDFKDANLRGKIIKTELLLKKWKNMLKIA